MKAAVDIDKPTDEITWRVEWLRHGGFTKRNATILAKLPIDYRYANKVMKDCKEKGYDETFVMNLIT
jgi:hypothetical protein